MIIENNISEQIASYNRDVEAWSKRVSNQTVSRIGRLCSSRNVTSKLFEPGTNLEEPLAKSFDYRNYKQDGEIHRIGFFFARHGVFVQKGVGRGHIMQNGFVTRGHKQKVGRNKNDNRVFFITTAGVINRKPKDWFNGPLIPAIETLADVVAEHYGDRVLNATDIKIR